MSAEREFVVLEEVWATWQDPELGEVVLMRHVLRRQRRRGENDLGDRSKYFAFVRGQHSGVAITGLQAFAARGGDAGARSEVCRRISRGERPPLAMEQVNREDQGQREGAEGER